MQCRKPSLLHSAFCCPNRCESFPFIWTSWLPGSIPLAYKCLSGSCRTCTVVSWPNAKNRCKKHNSFMRRSIDGALTYWTPEMFMWKTFNIPMGSWSPQRTCLIKICSAATLSDMALEVWPHGELFNALECSTKFSFRHLPVWPTSAFPQEKTTL